MSPKISICIPAYNHEKFIAATIQSILDQTFQDFEIIISDDNSKDDTVKIAQSFKDERIKVIKNSVNGGPSINCNIAISQARGQYLALIASDDMMDKKRLEKTLKFLDENPKYCAVFTYINTIDENGKLVLGHHQEKSFNQSFGSRFEILNQFFYKGNFLCAPSCLIKRDVLLSTGGFNPCLWQLQDFDLWIKILIAGHEIGFLDEKLTFYRVHDNNLSCVGGAVNVGFASRGYFEHVKVLDNFLEIKNLQDFKKIFPNIDNCLSEEKIPFCLAKEASAIAEKKSPSLESQCYKDFAINIFYNKTKNCFLKFPDDFLMKDFLSLLSTNYFIVTIEDMKSQIYSLGGNIKNPKKNILNRLKRKFNKVLFGYRKLLTALK